MVLFFFSSRRRHTRCYRDWSSDVCSSDLEAPRVGLEPRQRLRLHAVLQELAFPEREALPGGELDFRWTLHRRIQAGDVHLAVGRLQATEQASELFVRVGRRAAKLARVQVRLRGAHS